MATPGRDGRLAARDDPPGALAVLLVGASTAHPSHRPIGRATLRILTFTMLYPGVAAPGRAVFVANRLERLVATKQVQATVVAPVPWTPIVSRFRGESRHVPVEEERNGITVHHPRWYRWPLIETFSPTMLFRGARPLIARLLREGSDFDLIDAHYFYPDGVAAVALAQAFDKPVCITARGSDLNVHARQEAVRPLIVDAAERAQGLIAVSEGLKRRLVELGIRDERIRVLRNGVDLDVFTPDGRERARERLGLSGPTLLSVGNLIEAKGHDIAIRALAHLPETRLLIAGAGEFRGALEREALRAGVAGRVRFLGLVPHHDLPAIYAAADCLVLASRAEGWPNVLLEAMACGTPAIVSDIEGGPRELVTNEHPESGRRMPERNEQALAAAVQDLFAHRPARSATRRYAEQFPWDPTTRGQLELFRSIIDAHEARAPSAKR